MKTLNKVIVTTTINPPTEAILKFDSLKDWKLIVIGDLKTPKDYKLERGIYVSPEEQEKYNKPLSDAIGWNEIARRNVGNLIARDMNADIVAIVDDDNIPLSHWGEDLIAGQEAEVNWYHTALECFDPVGATNYPHLWHRGFPPQLIHKREYSSMQKKKMKVDIQADFWNGDPDIDAIARIGYAPVCEFDDKYFPISANKPSPFNSQNIFITKEVLPHFFILPHLTPRGRMGDIWMAYHLQALGFKVAYARASVYQDRNEHDLVVDLKDELIGYERCMDIVKAINAKKYSENDFWPSKTIQAYRKYKECFPV